MEQSQVMPQAYICGACGQKWEGDNCVQQYYDHTCSVTNYQPTNPLHFGPEFTAIAEAAQQRGAAYKIDASKQPPQ
jgi:hypothetical protein